MAFGGNRKAATAPFGAVERVELEVRTDEILVLQWVHGWGPWFYKHSACVMAGLPDPLFVYQLFARSQFPMTTAPPLGQTQDQTVIEFDVRTDEMLVNMGPQ